ncbi:hypothetical protein RAS12_03105 [Achromobacter seleniivolatilans]|uniref:RES domain-containing protein n=1 Tax=Achromobacter seleniivolatilans TaxID=3047478 RepID=A0ABY9M3L6_9BURK|nr:hypothetical protein [Achromobacter sp. R39]WMD21370.1 hypothetical protein RAS12_03105 [Achromobacter sp. R39]
MSTISVDAQPAIAPARVSVGWDSDIHNLYCTIEYPAKNTTDPAPPRLLSDVLDQQWPLPIPRWVIVADALSMVLDAGKRLKDFDIRTNPSDWTLTSIAPAIGAFAQPYVQAPFDDHGDATCRPVEAEEYDSEHGIFCLSWGQAQRWCVVAPTLALGLAEDGALMRIQLSEFWV